MPRSNYLVIFHEPYFQSFPYFARRIFHFKGNHFWVMLAHFDEFSTFGEGEIKKQVCLFLLDFWVIRLDSVRRASREAEESFYSVFFFFSITVSLFCRHDDLKEMLDSNKDSLKLEAMKRIVAVSTHPWRIWLSHLRKSVKLCTFLSKQKSKCEKGCNWPFVAVPEPLKTFILLICFALSVCFLVQMIARGKNASDLFPAVVKNVACKNIEVCGELHVSSQLKFLSALQSKSFCKVLLSSAWSV